MPEYSAGKISEYADGDRRVLKCGEAEIGVFRIGGLFHGWHNSCAHLGGPVCQGRIMQRVIEPADSEGRTRTLDYEAGSAHIACPWHGYEFDLKTGHHAGTSRFRLKKANLKMRDGEIFIVL